MKFIPTSPKMQRLFERFYKVGVVIKGLDGLVELLAGLVLLIAPHSLHRLLGGVAHKASGHRGHTFHFIAEYVARLDSDLARSGLVFLIIFLISHGVIKLALVYCLLKEILWAYPYALAVLGLFLVYQLYVFATSPSIGMGLFVVLDVIILYFVWGEWRELKAKK